MGDDDRILALIKLMKQVEENNKAIAAGLPLPHPLLWEEKERIANKYHRELWCDEIENDEDYTYE